MSGHLLRRHAPIPSEVWDLLEQEAKQRLTVALSARRLVDVEGPKGWEHSATNLGRVSGVVSAPAEGVIARIRSVLPLTEIRGDFTLLREEIINATRGAADVDLAALDEAAHRIASVENAAVFSGWDEVGIIGIVQASPHQALHYEPGTTAYDDLVASAVATLKRSGIAGPYALALGPEDWAEIADASDQGGYPLVRHLRDILGGPIEWVPGLTGGVVLSQRGGDFILDLGEDLSLGYDSHTPTTVDLYLEETMSFRVATPEAAIAIMAV